MLDKTYYLDKALVRKDFQRVVGSYDQAAVIQHEVGRRVLERLRYIKHKPRIILDIGCGTGRSTKALIKRYAKSKVVALDLSDAMLCKTRSNCGRLRRPSLLCADAETLPVRADCIDLVHSNLSFQWCNDLQRLFAELHRVSKAGALLMFTTFGPDTLKELRSSWAQVDSYTHVNGFIDMHDIGDALLRAGFADPVMDMEVLTVTYTAVKGLVSDLKRIGAQNKTFGRARSLTGRQRFQKMCRAYEEFRTKAGLFPASFEIIYGHAWRAEKPAGTGETQSEYRIPVEQLRRR